MNAKVIVKLKKFDFILNYLRVKLFLLMEIKYILVLLNLLGAFLLANALLRAYYMITLQG